MKSFKRCGISNDVDGSANDLYLSNYSDDYRQEFTAFK